MEAELLVARAVTVAGTPSIATEARARVRCALAQYGDALSDVLLRNRNRNPMELIDRHNEAYTELAHAVRDAGTDVGLES